MKVKDNKCLPVTPFCVSSAAGTRAEGDDCPSNRPGGAAGQRGDRQNLPGEAAAEGPKSQGGGEIFTRSLCPANSELQFLQGGNANFW